MTLKRLRGSLLPFRNISHPKNQADLVNRGTPLECQRGSKFAQLPEDILLLFWDHLDKTAKACVVQTCRYLRHMLEATLYIHLSPRRVDLLHRTLAERPDLIPYIRSYLGPLVPHPIESRVRPRRKRALLNFLRRWKVVESVGPPAPPFTETETFKNAVFIFSKATQIVDLDFTDNHDWASDPIFKPIKAAVFSMSLTRLYLWHCAEPAQVLRAQPELEHLEVGWGVRWAEKLDTADLPKLRSLAATLEDASYIVPGRPTEQLELISRFSSNDFDPALFKSLALSTGPIINLTMRVYHRWCDPTAQSPLQIVSQTLPDLEQLTVTIYGPIPGQVILDEIPSFQALRRLVLLNAEMATGAEVASSWSSREADDLVDPLRGDDVVHHDVVVNDWDDIFRRLKTLCPLLVEVERIPPTFIW